MFSQFRVGPQSLNRCFALVTPVRLYASEGHGYGKLFTLGIPPNRLFNLTLGSWEGAFAVSLDWQRSKCQSLRHGCCKRSSYYRQLCRAVFWHLELGHVVVQPRPPYLFFISGNIWNFLAMANLYGHATNGDRCRYWRWRSW